MNVHEQEQIEEIRSWWRENRWYILGGLIASVVVVGGWRMWVEHQQELAETASAKYDAVVTQASLADRTALEQSVAELQADYSGTPYASLGTLKLAAAQVEGGDFAAAADSLRWVVDNADDAELVLVGRLRLGRVLLEQDDVAGVHAALDVADAGRFEALFEELRGDAFLVAGDRDNARTAYEGALAAITSGDPGDRALVQMKLDNLAMPLDALLAKGAADETTAEDAADIEE